MIRILVAEEDTAFRELLGVLLVDEGYGAQLAATAEEALAALGAERFDLVLTGLDAPEAVQAIVGAAGGAPVLVVCAQPRWQRARLVTPADAALVYAPFDVEDLLARIKVLLALRPRGQAAASARP